MKKIKMEKSDLVEKVALQRASSLSPPQPAGIVGQNTDESHDSLLEANSKIALEAADLSVQDQLDTFATDTNLLIKSSALSHQQASQQLSQESQQQPSLQSSPQQQQQQHQQQQQQQTQAFTGRALPPGAPANYCNICNKELCNKYFMKTHMQKMHGINLDDLPREAANSGGVVCDICQKELCSKYFLKVHKSNTHGITDFTSGQAGSQAANAATAVAAIALTNYSLNNAQKRVAINLALNQHQLQNRQAAALINAAAAGSPPTNFSSHLQIAQAAKVAAIHQRDQQLYASSLISQLQLQQHQQQQTTKQRAHHQHKSALPVAQHQLDLRLHPHQHPSKQQQAQQHPHSQSQPHVHQGIPETGLSIASNLTSNFSASLLAATVNNPLLAAQLAQQQFPALNSHIPTTTGTIQQSRQQSQQQPHSFYGARETSLLDTEDDTSDRDSLTDQSSDLQHQQQSHRKRCLDMNNFHQQLQNQQALLNATAVFNPAAAAAAMVAMHQHHHRQQSHLQHHQRQDSNVTHTAADGLVQPVAIDLRNQQSAMSQLLAQKMLEAAVQHPNEQHQLVTNNCTDVDVLTPTTQAQRGPINLLDKCKAQKNSPSHHNRYLAQEDDNVDEEVEGEDVEEQDEDGFADSDRDSSSYQGEESVQIEVNAKALAPSHFSSASLVGYDSSALDNSIVRSSLASSTNHSSDFTPEHPVNCATDPKRMAPKSNNNGSNNKRLKQHHHLKSAISKSQTQLENLGSSTLRLASSLAAQMSNNLPNLNHQTTTDHSPSVNYSSSDLSMLHQHTRTVPAGSADNNNNLCSNINNGSTPQQPNNNNTGNSNSRYLRHYTEACPICDRRFKSIKWLQSHVMNDHKNEIGNLFNLLFQVLLCGGSGENNGGAVDTTGSLSSDPQSLNPLVGGLIGDGSGGGADSALDISQYLAGMLNVAELSQQQQPQQQHPLSQTSVGATLAAVGLPNPTPTQNKPPSASSTIINNRGDA